MFHIHSGHLFLFDVEILYGNRMEKTHVPRSLDSLFKVMILEIQLEMIFHHDSSPEKWPSHHQRIPDICRGRHGNCPWRFREFFVMWRNFIYKPILDVEEH